jgi:hypothetical protein
VGGPMQIRPGSSCQGHMMRLTLRAPK